MSQYTRLIKRQSPLYGYSCRYPILLFAVGFRQSTLLLSLKGEYKMISLVIVITITATPALLPPSPPAQFGKAHFDVDTFAPEDQAKEVGIFDESKWDECVFE